MLLLLYFLSASLQIKGGVHNKYFPTVSENVTEKTFPADLEVNTTFDMVLVKCPGYEYNHRNVNETFVFSSDLKKLKLSMFTKDYLFAWTPLVEKSSES